jgi:hypothetical protein
MDMEPRISVITLGVQDLERALDFYLAGLGLPLEGERDEVDGIAFFRLNPHLRLALYPWEALAEDAQAEADGQGFRGITIAHNVRERDQVDAVMQTAVDAGARLVKEPQEVFWGGYSGYFADPDGHLWEVAFNPYDDIVAEETS